MPEGIELPRKPKPPAESWWANRPREGFTDHARQRQFKDTPETKRALEGEPAPRKFVGKWVSG